MDLDADKLLVEINSGNRLSGETLARVASYLESIDLAAAEGLDLDNLYALLLVLARAHSYEHGYLFEKFFELQDAMTAIMILETFCVDWNRTEEYLEHVLRFALGAGWDEDGDVQQFALKIVGEHVRSYLERDATTASEKHHLKRLVELVLRTFDDESNDRWVRQAAYRALGRIAMKEWEELPGECSMPNFDPASGSFDPEVVSSVRQLALELSSSAGSESSSSVSKLSGRGASGEQIPGPPGMR